MRREAAFVKSRASQPPPEVERPQNEQEQVAYLERLCGQQALELERLALGGRSVKKVWHQLPSVPCHALIERLRELMPNVSVRKWCTLLTINRQWYDQHRGYAVQNDRDRPPVPGEASAAEGRGFLWLSPDDESTKAGRAGRSIISGWSSKRASACRRKPRYVHTTDSKHGEPVSPHLIKDLPIEALNQCWVADLTSVRLPEGEVFLACLLDAYSRTRGQRAS